MCTRTEFRRWNRASPTALRATTRGMSGGSSRDLQERGRTSGPTLRTESFVSAASNGAGGTALWSKSQHWEAGSGQFLGDSFGLRAYSFDPPARPSRQMGRPKWTQGYTAAARCKALCRNLVEHKPQVYIHCSGSVFTSGGQTVSLPCCTAPPLL